MPDLEQMGERFRTLFTRWFILLCKRSTLDEIKELPLLDEPITVYTFQSDKASFAQTTLVGTIIWNTTKMDQLSQQARRLVLVHERSHRDRNPVYKVIFYGTIVWIAIGATFLTIAVVLLLLGTPLLDLTRLVAISLALVFPFLIMFRIEETIADYHALSALGEEEYLDACEEIADVRNPTLRGQIKRKLFYTDPEDTVRLYRWTQQFSLA